MRRTVYTVGDGGPIRKVPLPHVKKVLTPAVPLTAHVDSPFLIQLVNDLEISPEKLRLLCERVGEYKKSKDVLHVVEHELVFEALLAYANEKVAKFLAARAALYSRVQEDRQANLARRQDIGKHRD